jgi:hypothetical protein
VPKNLRLPQLGKISRDIFGDFGSHLRFEFLEKGMIDFSARSQQTTINVVVAGKRIQSLCQSPDKTFTQLEFDVMAFAIRHRSGRTGAGAARESPRQVCDFVNQPAVSVRVVKLFDKLQPGSLSEMMVIVFELKSFETSEISDHK